MKSETLLIYALSDLERSTPRWGLSTSQSIHRCLTHAFIEGDCDPILPLRTLGIAAASANLGHISQWEGDYQKALSYLHDSIELFKEMSRGNRTYETAVADRLVDLAQLHQKIGDYAQSLRHYTIRLLRFLQKFNSNDRLRAVLNDVGLLYLEQGDFKPPRYLDMSLAASLAAGDKIRAARPLAISELPAKGTATTRSPCRVFNELWRYGDAPSSLVIVIEEGLGTVYWARGNTTSLTTIALRLADKLATENVGPSCCGAKGDQLLARRLR
jgi:tetratricopeptide (TPR) repeat protein